MAEVSTDHLDTSESPNVLDDSTDNDDWEYSSNASSADINAYTHDEQMSVFADTVPLHDPLNDPTHCTCIGHSGPGVTENHYTSLNTHKNEIRLLKILPCSRIGKLHCHVSTYDLGAAPIYLALSYTWGEPLPVHNVILNGTELAVRENLWAFLSEIATWRRYRTSFFWIDSICINQLNIHERGHQVSMMARIYRQAHCVIAWLGKADRGSQTVMQLMSSLRPPVESDVIIGFWLNLAAGERIAFRDICERRYWERLWVLQELALASDCVILCGNQSLPFKLFERILEVAETREPSWEIRRNFANDLLRLDENALNFKQQTRASTMIEEIGLTRIRATLAEHAISCLRLKCTDPMDRAYALLGLLGPEYDVIYADYTLTPSDLVDLLLGDHVPHSRSSQHEIEPRELRQAFGLPFDEFHDDSWKIRETAVNVANSDIDDQYSGRSRRRFGLRTNVDFEFCSYARHGRTSAMQVLIDNDLAHINRLVTLSPELPRMSALHLASLGGHKAAVKLLLNRPAIQVNFRSGSGITGLQIATQMSQRTIARMIQERINVDIGERDQ